MSTMATIETNNLWDTATAADFLGLTPDTVKKYCQNGAIQAMKFGRSWMIAKEEVRRYKKENLGKQGRAKKEE